MPLPHQQAASAVQVSRRRAVELQALAPGGKRSHRSQARRHRQRVRQLHPPTIRRSLPCLDQRRQTFGDSSLRVSARFAVIPRTRGPRRRFRTAAPAPRRRSALHERAAVSAYPREAVLLLHGARMNRCVMAYLAFALEREGFAVQALSYRTMRGTLAEHLARVAERIAALEARRVP